MWYVEHVENFHGMPVCTFPRDVPSPELPDAGAVAWRLECSGYYGEESRDDYWQRFLDLVPSERVRALVLGAGWYDTHYEDDGSEAAEFLVGVRERFPALEALFLGDLESEESEISWIGQGDVGPVLAAYPGLRELVVRGGQGLVFPVLRHENLRSLRFETGGLPAAVVRNVAASELPALESLSLWLGVSYYGGDATLEDLQPLLSAGRFPALTHLGLQNSEVQDAIAAAVASAPVVAQLASLDLSMGTLTDAGAEALLNGQPLTHLEALNLRHHFLSATMAERITAALAPAGVAVDLGDVQKPDVYDGEESRYVAVSE